MNDSESSKEMNIIKLLPIRMTSKIIEGFGRGSKDLGIPTANLSREDIKCLVGFDNLPTGIYWGFARIVTEGGSELQAHQDLTQRVYKTAISIGFNPCYGNDAKTIEPHLIAPSGDPKRKASICEETQFSDFYGDHIRLSIIGYLRPELPFEGLEKLKEAIKGDISQAEKLGDGNDEFIKIEREWVDSDGKAV